MMPAIVIVLPVPVAPSRVTIRSPAGQRRGGLVDGPRLVGGGGEDRIQAKLGHDL